MYITIYQERPLNKQPCLLYTLINYKTVTSLNCQGYKPHSPSFPNQKLMPDPDYSTVDGHVNKLYQDHNTVHAHSSLDIKQPELDFQETSSTRVSRLFYSEKNAAGTLSSTDNRL